jgi:branched-subunit amino acid transport protein
MTLWLTIIAMGVITFALRLSLVGALGQITLPPLLVRGLRFVPPAVLMAIIVPELVLPSGQLDLSLGNVRLLAGVLAAVVAWTSKSVILTVVVGMAALWLLTALLGG